MQAIPNTVSHTLMLAISWKMLLQVSTKVFPDARIPNKSFTCDVTIINAAADVNPEDTGPDTKSIRNPIRVQLMKKIISTG